MKRFIHFLLGCPLQHSHTRVLLVHSFAFRVSSSTFTQTSSLLIHSLLLGCPLKPTEKASFGSFICFSEETSTFKQTVSLLIHSLLFGCPHRHSQKRCGKMRTLDTKVKKRRNDAWRMGKINCRGDADESESNSRCPAVGRTLLRHAGQLPFAQRLLFITFNYIFQIIQTFIFSLLPKVVKTRVSMKNEEKTRKKFNLCIYEQKPISVTTMHCRVEWFWKKVLNHSTLMHSATFPTGRLMQAKLCCGSSTI